MIIEAWNPASMLRFWPLRNDHAGLASHASPEATSRGDTGRPPAFWIVKSIPASLSVSREVGLAGACRWARGTRC